ncbi:hypothetical protein TepRe1_1376 [Tepidanaerobacter acetatoxydans Re1]|nr:hypothetical protein TepRe1_1376 [Tepidanaerobacter acetatoxydans Re1]
MTGINKRLVIIICLLLFLIAGSFIFKIFDNSRIPKSAKLVFLLRE